MGSDETKWRSVYLIPVFIAAAIAVAAGLFARETDVFVHQRIAWLEKP